MNKLFAIIAIATIHLLLTFASQATAQSPKRIEFAKGKSSATVAGTTGRYGAAYILRAKSGQKLVLNLPSSPKVGIKVTTVGRFGEMVLLREEGGGTYEVGLEETGDYMIFIGSTNNKPVSFTLTVKVGKLADV